MLENIEESTTVGEIKFFHGNYRGMVVSDYDPNVKGKVKIYVPGVYPEELAENPSTLPWAEPAMSLFGGSWTNEREGDLNSETGVTSIPHSSKMPLEGAQVWVLFEQGNWMRPIYFAACQGGDGWHSEHNNQHVIKTDNVRVRVDENPGDSKSSCKFDSYNENCNTNGGNTVATDVMTTVDLEVKGNVNIIVNGNVNMKINGNFYEQHTGNKYETLEGDLYRKHTGDVYIQHEGDVLHEHEGDVLHEHEGDRTYIQTGDQIEEQEGDQTYTQTGDQTYTQIGDQIYTQIGEQYYTEKGDRIHTRIGDEDDFQKGDKNEIQVGDLTVTAVGDEINTKNGKLTRTITAANQQEAAQGKGSETVTILTDSTKSVGSSIKNTAGVQIANTASVIKDNGGVILHN